jgi:transglutaminase-like putative cysteine protease
MKSFGLLILGSLVALLSGEWTLCTAEASTPAADNSFARSAIYSVHHELTVTDIPSGAQRVRVWFWLPDDDAQQKVLELQASTSAGPPGSAAEIRITRDPVYGHRYLYLSAPHPGPTTLSLQTDFVIRRSAVSIQLDPQKAGSLTDVHRAEFAAELRRDVPNMQVTAQMAALADQICGDERNVVRQARLLFDYVVSNTNHYSRPNAPKSSGKGSADYCLSQKGGSCTDMHALFIAMARARGIPTRLHFGSLLKAANEGKDIDPGYRCWVEYFVPNYGWVPMDIAAANTNADRRDFYFSGLDERRIRFSEGRNLDLSPRQDAAESLNLMLVAYLEVDGQPHTSFKRVLKYTEITTPWPPVP